MSQWNLLSKKSNQFGGILFCACSLCPVVPGEGGGTTKPAKRKPVIINGRRAKTVDVHTHCLFQEAMDLLDDKGLSIIPPTLGAQEHFIRTEVGLNQRISDMDEMGIDVEILSVNPYWYALDRDHAEKICAINNQCLMDLNKLYPDRLYGFAALAMQFPDLAVKQLEEAMKNGLKGAAIGGSVLGDDFANPRFHPVLAKAEELGATLFIHPQSTPQLGARFKGNGWLANIIGNPLDTTIALEKLIFEGVFDKFPKLKVLAAHGGGFLGSYAPRMDVGCSISPVNCNPDIRLQKKPTEYLNQIYFDALVFTGEALRHLAAQVGASQIMIGTDWPIPWELDPVGHIMATPELSDEDRFQILGGNANRVFGLDLYKDA